MIEKRTWLRSSALTACSLALLHAWAGCTETASPPTADSALKPPCERCGPRALTPWSAQLHLHGSFSEGVGSFDSHSFEANEVGADAIWWSDHDFRITGHQHATRFSFDRETEPLDHAEAWKSALPFQRDYSKYLRPLKGRIHPQAEATFESGDRAQNVEGQGSLRVALSSPASDFSEHLLVLDSARHLFRRSLAKEVKLELAVLPISIGPNARAVVEVALSEHPMDGEPQQLILRYLLGAEQDAVRREGKTLVISRRLKPGEWNQLELPVSLDVVSGFPEIDGLDNSLHELRIGVESRLGAPIEVWFDALVLEDGATGEAAFDRYRDAIAYWNGKTELTQLVGQELSWLSRHMNEFSEHTNPIDYDALLTFEDFDADSPPTAPGSHEYDPLTGPTRRDSKLELTPKLVDIVHSRGGLVSYNHMFGTRMTGVAPNKKRSPERVFQELLETRVYGSDILEVGYRDRAGRTLAEFVWVWDQLAKHGLPLIGVGVSDSHGGPEQRWRTSSNNMLSWIYASSTQRGDLLNGLRAGAVYFGDIVLFDGRVDLVTEAGERMGQVVITDRGAARVWIQVDGLEPDDVIHVIDSGDRVGSHVAGASRFERVHDLAIRDTPTFVRIEAETADGQTKLLSNPIHFARSVPAGGLAGERAVIDLGGVRSGALEGIRIHAATLASGESADRVLEIRGAARGGSAQLSLPADAGPVHVELEGLEGSWQSDAHVLSLTDLEGEGRLRVRFTQRRSAAGEPVAPN